MATIKMRKDKYVVIYDYYDEHGKRKQKWESFNDKKEAQIFKKQIELDKLNQNLVKPNVTTIESFLLEWANLHGKARWQFNTFTNNIAMIKNHVLPLIGNMKIQDVTPKDIDLMFDSLRAKKVSGTKSYNKKDEDIPCLSSTTLRHIYIILKKAFDKAVTWKLIQSNPVACEAPKKNKGKRNVWDAETFRMVLEEMEDPLLHLAVHTAFICSLRLGETMGLTWDCIDFEKKVLHIKKTVQRVSREALSKLPKDNVILLFPPRMEISNSLLIMKTPKTTTSNRFVYFTEPLKEELLKRKRQIEREKNFLGDDYKDFNLVFALNDGFPIEPKLCEKWFKKWQSKTSLDVSDLIFHEIRHSSTTYKLGISGGDIKSVQGDTGHASGEMVVDIYAHMADKNRADLTRSIEDDFYGSNKKQTKNIDDDAVEVLVDAIKKDPLLQQKILDAILARKD